MGLADSPGKAARMAREVPAHLVLFDVLALRGRSLVSLPYTESRRRLADLGLAGPLHRLDRGRAVEATGLAPTPI